MPSFAFDTATVAQAQAFGSTDTLVLTGTAATGGTGNALANALAGNAAASAKSPMII